MENGKKGPTHVIKRSPACEKRVEGQACQVWCRLFLLQHYEGESRCCIMASPARSTDNADEHKKNAQDLRRSRGRKI